MEPEDIVSENPEDIFALADTRYEAMYNLICERRILVVYGGENVKAADITVLDAELDEDK